MLDLYYWPTPNGHKITLFLEEAGLPYQIKPINIGAGDQFKPEFLAISPNNKMPALVDHAPIDGGEPIALFESGVILQYLAEKTGKFLPTALRARYQTLQWLYWQVGGLGPMLGQNHHFNHYATEKVPYAIERYINETRRLYGVLDKQLSDRDFIAGNEYSIADMACHPWIVSHELQDISLADFPNIQRWFNAIAARPASQRAYALSEQINPNDGKPLTDQEHQQLFGKATTKK